MHAAIYFVTLVGLLPEVAAGSTHSTHDAWMRSGQAVVRPYIINGLNKTEIRWAVRAYPNGEVLRLNGTIQEVHAQLLALNPNYDSDFGIKNGDITSLHEHILSTSAEHETEYEADTTPFDKENEFEGDSFPYNCSPDFFKGTDLAHIIKGIEHLLRIPGIPENGPGPGRCGRVSCSNNSGIWWCNDVRKKTPRTIESIPSVRIVYMDRHIGRANNPQRPEQKKLKSFKAIADGTIYIVNRCTKPDPLKIRNLVYGQVTHPEGWTVIVRRDKC